MYLFQYAGSVAGRSNPSIMLLTPLDEIGQERRAFLLTTYQQLLDVLGPDNTTDLDAEEKVGASWGFTDEAGRQGFVWAYGYTPQNVACCQRWSTDGDRALLEELFPGLLE